MPSKKKQILIALGIAVLGLTGFGVYRAFYKDRVIATVGDYEITQKDKVLRDQIQQIFYPQDPHSYGLDQLTTAYTYAQILKNNGHEITEHLLRAEDMRINKNTKAPEVLKKIRDLFKGDDEAYQKVFILPTYAERTIYYDFFAKNPKAQEHSLGKVREFLSELEKTKSPLQELARKSDLTFKKFTLSKEKGIEWEKETSLKKAGGAPEKPGLIDMSAQAPAEIRHQIDQETQGKSLESAQFWVDNVIKHMKPGEVFQSPVDFEETWLIVKYGKLISKGKFQLEAVFIPKDNYQQWLDAETAKFRVQR
jgi:hypothetical protein